MKGNSTWTSYNAAQSEEKHRFVEFLADLCSTIPQPEQVMGRPRLLLSDMLFAAAYKVYVGFSARRFTRQVRRASALAAEEMVGEDASVSPGALRELAAVEHLFTRRNLPVARAFVLLRACLGKAPPDFEEMLGLRNQLYWKLYGLLPFSGEAELNRRYERISNFERGSGQFGKLRRGNERAATAVALKNLSLNAGLSDADALRAFLSAG